MREKKRKPVERDQRLRNLLPLLESLPEELRDALVTTLEAVVRTSRLIEVHQKERKEGHETQNIQAPKGRRQRPRA